MDKRARFDLERAVAGFTSDTDGRLYFDETAPAAYRLEPPGAECMALACPACTHVTIKPGAPRRSHAIACSSCGRWWLLTPPPEVIAFGASGLSIAGVDQGSRRLPS